MGRQPGTGRTAPWGRTSHMGGNRGSPTVRCAAQLRHSQAPRCVCRCFHKASTATPAPLTSCSFSGRPLSPPDAVCRSHSLAVTTAGRRSEHGGKVLSGRAANIYLFCTQLYAVTVYAIVHWYANA